MKAKVKGGRRWTPSGTTEINSPRLQNKASWDTFLERKHKTINKKTIIFLLLFFKECFELFLCQNLQKLD